MERLQAGKSILCALWLIAIWVTNELIVFPLLKVPFLRGAIMKMFDSSEGGWS